MYGESLLPLKKGYFSVMAIVTCRYSFPVVYYLYETMAPATAEKKLLLVSLVIFPLLRAISTS